MSTYTIKTPEMREMVVSHINSRPLPFTVHIEKGAKRSTEQERMHRLWMRELEEQGDHTAEEYRGFCKLWFGVRLMKYQSEKWAEAYDRIVKPLDYEQKLALMMEPISYPLTSLMTSKTFTRYLDDVFHFWTGRPLDEEGTLDELGLQHFRMIERKRTEQEVPIFMLTKPNEDDRS